MKDFLRRCLAMLLVVSMVLGTGVTGVFAASAGSEDNGPVADTENAIIAEPSDDLELIQDTLDSAKNQLSVDTSDEEVVFIVELEGDALLDTKPGSLTMNQYISTSDGEDAMKLIANQQESVMSYLLKERSVITIEYRYQVVLNGFAVTAPLSYLSYLESIPGVKSVSISQTYEYVEPVDGYTEIRQTSGVMMDSDSANAAGYTGKGTVTAVLDTGIDVDHDAFQKDPEGARLTLSDIEDLVAGGELNATAAASELYHSAKIPFGFDYTGNTADVNDTQGHGTHVAGTVGGNCDEFTGVAPDTQIVFMKVFNDQGGGATDAVIFAALEDCVLIGVDSINMSLGTPSGFTYENKATDDVYSKVMDAGINLMVSCGNETSSTNNATATGLPMLDEPDNGIVGSPSTYEASLSVASVNEYQDYVTYILSGERQLRYADSNIDTELDFINTFHGQTLEYVVVPNFGSPEDFATVDVNGKIALVSRGSLNFSEKEQNAKNAGAIGMIVYDNAEGSLVYMQGNDLLPMVFISKADGEALIAQENKTVSVSRDYNVFVDTSDGGLMSGFSSLGVAPDMTMKPEITAPGGYVYSTMPGNTYASMSGTSMASPHMAGAASVVRQYINEEFPELSNTEKQVLINTLLMNTAVPVEDEYGVPYTVRKQGSGLAQVNAAINTGAYVTVEGCYRPKAELGDSASGYFSKEITLVIHNISDESLFYNMSAIPLTAQEETVVVDGVKYNCVSEHSRIMSEDEFQVIFSQDTVAVPAGSTATVHVKLRLTEEGEESLSAFTNGTFLDGFIILESQDSDIDLSVPYLGFYGDWGQASVFDDSIYDEEEEASVYASAMAMLDPYSGSGFYLGSNIYTDEECVDLDKIAISMDMLRSGYRPFSLLGLLRAPKSITYTVTDANGERLELIDEAAGYASVGYEYTVRNVIKSFYYSNGDYINYEIGPLYNGWLPCASEDGITYYWLDDGQYYLNATAQVDGTDSEAGTQTYTFPITMDSQVPSVVSHHYEEIDGKSFVTFELTDNHYVMVFQVVSPDGMNAFSPAIPVDEDEVGAISSYTFDVTELLAAGYTSAYVYIFDYALNEALVEIPINGDTIQPTSVAINNRIGSVSGNQTFQIEAYVLPADASDFTLSWSTSDERVATVRDTGMTRYDEDAGMTFYIAEVTTKNITSEVTLTVSTSNGMSDSITFWVVGEYTDLPSDYVIREDGTYILPENLNTKVRITDNARNVTIMGNSVNTAGNPYQGLYLCSEVQNLNLTIRDLNVTADSSNPIIEFTGTGNQLILEGENNLTGKLYSNAALVEVNASTALTVSGDGTLNLTLPANSYGAGIGSEASADCGTLVINGGTINAVTQGAGAAIGGGQCTSAGGAAPSITINGGDVTVYAQYTSSNYGNTGAGIGAGAGVSTGTTNITIHGGTVNATTSTYAAAIGGTDIYGYMSGSDTINITINGGKVTASARNAGTNTTGAAIGSGYIGSTANITISGGEVIAVTETGAAAIGSGSSGGSTSKAATITISGGTVSAFANNSGSSYKGAAIGKGYNAANSTVTIDAGAVLAVGSTGMSKTPINSSGTSLTEVTLNMPGIQSLMIDGRDWKVSANHADFSADGGSDYSDEVHVWLVPNDTTPYIGTVQFEDDTKTYEIWTNGNVYEFHTVTYNLTNLVTDGASKVYDPSAGNVNADLIGTLRTTASTYSLPRAITITIDGADADFTYDPATGAFSVDKSLLTGEVVITAAAEEVVDKTALNALIAQVVAMDPEAYTGDSWSAVASALEAAQAAAAEDPTTQAAIDAAYNALKAAVDALIVRADFSALEALIAEAEKKNEQNYVSDTWGPFAEALENAQAVAENSNSTEAEVKATYDALKAAMDALIARGDKTELRKLIDQADVLFARNYTSSSFSALEEALADAIEVYTDPDATQEEVDAACAALKAALDALEPVANKDLLLALIAKAESLDSENYTAETWATLEKALEEAKAVAEDENAVQTAIEAAAAALQQAIADLTLLGDTSALEEAIEKAESLDQKEYDPETWSDLEEALEDAKEVVDDPNATQADVDAALEALEAAMDNLSKLGDKTALQAAYNVCLTLDESAYTKESWSALTEAMAQAKTVLDDPYATQEEIDTAYNALITALNALDPVSTEPENPTDELEKPDSVIRLAGAHRWETAIKVADEMKANLGVDKFDTIIIASGNDFADALAGSYLSTVKSAPILLSWGQGGKYAYLDEDNIAYIKANLAEGGTVYILGGEKAVPASYEEALKDYNVERLGGANRFETNLLILAEAGVNKGDEILVCTSTNFADSLSASATGKPILLVFNNYKALYGEQPEYLATLEDCTFTIVGGESAICAELETAIKTYGETTRLAGENRFETSVMVAKEYFEAPETAVLAYAWNYPDGLCGGALAYSMDAPLILTMTKYEAEAVAYATENTITSGVVLGGDGLISDEAVRSVFAMEDTDEIIVK